MIELSKKLLLLSLRTAREIICMHFCGRTDEGPGPNNAHVYDCNTILRLLETYR